MRSKIFYSTGAVIAMLAVLTVFFSIRPENFLRQSEPAVSQAEAATVSSVGQKAGANIFRITSAADFIAQDSFSPFTVEPSGIMPTGVYELARWRENGAIINHRSRRYPQVTTSAWWALSGYNEYYLITFADGTHALALFDHSFVKEKPITLPISIRAGTNSAAKPYLQTICAEYGADLDNVVYAFDDSWYEKHRGQILLIRLVITAIICVIAALLWAWGKKQFQKCRKEVKRL